MISEKFGSFEGKLPNPPKFNVKVSFGGLAVALLVLLAFNSYIVVGSGESVRIQNNLTGGYTWHTSEGIALKAPFFSNVERYNQEGTVAITDNDELCDTASICSLPREVRFADTYAITTEASFRFSLPKDSDTLEAMHDKVKNQKNLFGTTLAPFAQDLINYTSNQFRAEDFMQGGQNEFKARMIDQATYGMLVTKRSKEVIKTEMADRDSDRQSGKAHVGEQFVYSVKILEDENGKPLRNPTAISAYGVTIVPAGINLVDYTPENRLKDFMRAKQDQVRNRAKIVENQENERQKAITAQLTGDRERIQKQNLLLQQKDAARIEGEKAVVVANLEAEREKIDRQKVADLAIIDKKRELQIAKDNEAIQKANAVAAKHEANVIKEVGFAQAAVDKAKLAAKQTNKDIYLAELDLKAQLALAEVLPQVKIDMPSIVMGGSSGNSNAISDLLSTKLAKDVLSTTPSK